MSSSSGDNSVIGAVCILLLLWEVSGWVPRWRHSGDIAGSVTAAFNRLPLCHDLLLGSVRSFLNLVLYSLVHQHINKKSKEKKRNPGLSVPECNAAVRPTALLHDLDSDLFLFIYFLAFYEAMRMMANALIADQFDQGLQRGAKRAGLVKGLKRRCIAPFMQQLNSCLRWRVLTAACSFLLSLAWYACSIWCIRT